MEQVYESLGLSEVWLPDPRWPLDVSNFGRIRNRKDGKIRSFSSKKTGRVTRFIFQKKNLYVARLVAENFLVFRRPDQDCILHFDGDLLNCATWNLAWMTRTELFLYWKIKKEINQPPTL